MNDEKESNESKPILLVPAHIAILWPFFCTIHSVISHKLGTGGFQQSGMGELKPFNLEGLVACNWPHDYTKNMILAPAESDTEIQAD